MSDAIPILTKKERADWFAAMGSTPTNMMAFRAATEKIDGPARMITRLELTLRHVEQERDEALASR